MKVLASRARCVIPLHHEKATSPKHYRTSSLGGTTYERSTGQVIGGKAHWSTSREIPSFHFPYPGLIALVGVGLAYS